MCIRDRRNIAPVWQLAKACSKTVILGSDLAIGVGIGGSGTGSGAIFIGTGLLNTELFEILLAGAVRVIDPKPSPLPGFISSLGFP